MSSTVLYMSMSLDGFVAGPNAGPGNGLGDGGHRLHEWFLTDADADFEETPGGLRGVNGEIYDEMMSTGAVVAGRQTFEPADGWGGDHHDGVPIFILSRHPAPVWTAEWPAVHYVSDLETAIRDAKQAAGRARPRDRWDRWRGAQVLRCDHDRRDHTDRHDGHRGVGPAHRGRGADSRGELGPAVQPRGLERT